MTETTKQTVTHEDSVADLSARLAIVEIVLARFINRSSQSKKIGKDLDVIIEHLSTFQHNAEDEDENFVQSSMIRHARKMKEFLFLEEIDEEK